MPHVFMSSASTEVLTHQRDTTTLWLPANETYTSAAPMICACCRLPTSRKRVASEVKVLSLLYIVGPHMMVSISPPHDHACVIISSRSELMNAPAEPAAETSACATPDTGAGVVTSV